MDNYSKLKSYLTEEQLLETAKMNVVGLSNVQAQAMQIYTTHHDRDFINEHIFSTDCIVPLPKCAIGEAITEGSFHVDVDFMFNWYFNCKEPDLQIPPNSRICVCLGLDFYSPGRGVFGTFAAQNEGESGSHRLLLLSCVVLSVMEKEGINVVWSNPDTQKPGSRIPLALFRVGSLEGENQFAEFLPVIQSSIDKLKSIRFGNIVASLVICNGDLSMVQKLAGLGERSCPWCNLVSGRWVNEEYWYADTEEMKDENYKRERITGLNSKYPYAPDHGLHDGLCTCRKVHTSISEMAVRKGYEAAIVYIFQIAASNVDTEAGIVVAERYAEMEGLYQVPNSYSRDLARTNLNNQRQNRLSKYNYEMPVATEEDITAYVTLRNAENEYSHRHSQLVVPFVDWVHGNDDAAIVELFGGVSVKLQHFTERFTQSNNLWRIHKKGHAGVYGLTGAMAKLILSEKYADMIKSVVFSDCKDDVDVVGLHGYIVRVARLRTLYKSPTPQFAFDVATGKTTIAFQSQLTDLTTMLRDVREWRRDHLPWWTENDYAHVQSHSPWWMEYAATQLGCTLGALASENVEHIQQVVNHIIDNNTSQNLAQASITVQIMRRLVEYFMSHQLNPLKQQNNHERKRKMTNEEAAGKERCLLERQLLVHELSLTAVRAYDKSNIN